MEKILFRSFVVLILIFAFLVTLQTVLAQYDTGVGVGTFANATSIYSSTTTTTASSTSTTTTSLTTTTIPSVTPFVSVGIGANITSENPLQAVSTNGKIVAGIIAVIVVVILGEVHWFRKII